MSANDKSDAPPLSQRAEQLPALDFATFLMSIIGSACIHLGDAPSPDGSFTKGEGEANLILARQDIELLDLLQQKTKGNLTAEEKNLLAQALHDLRARYREVALET